MKLFWITHRTIAYEARAQKILDQFTDPHDRFHDQLMGVEWLLARKPNIGTPANKENPENFVLYVAKGDTLAKTSDMWLLYSYDDETVTVHGVRLENGL